MLTFYSWDYYSQLKHLKHLLIKAVPKITCSEAYYLQLRILFTSELLKRLFITIGSYANLFKCLLFTTGIIIHNKATQMLTVHKLFLW